MYLSPSYADVIGTGNVGYHAGRYDVHRQLGLSRHIVLMAQQFLPPHRYCEKEKETRDLH